MMPERRRNRLANAGQYRREKRKPKFNIRNMTVTIAQQLCRREFEPEHDEMIHRASQFCRNPANNLAGHRLGLKPELRARKNVVMQQGRMTRNMMTLARESTEDRFKHGKREPRRDSSSSVTATVPSQPLRLPFLNDGLEAVRDSYC